MRVVFIVILFSGLIYANIKLGMPKNPVSKTFNKLETYLQQSGISKKHNIEIVYVVNPEKSNKSLF